MNDNSSTKLRPSPMAEAILWLRANGIYFVRVNDFHLRIGRINYYPDRGKIYIDGGRKHPERGLAALQKLLRPRIKPQTTGGVALNIRQQDTPPSKAETDVIEFRFDDDE